MSEATMIAHDVPEGWYADPENPRMQRYWDGSDWSDHVRYSDVASMPRLTIAAEPSFHFDSDVASLADHQAVLAYISRPSVAAPSAVEAPFVIEVPALASPAYAALSYAAPSFAAPAFEPQQHLAAEPYFVAPSFAAVPQPFAKRDFSAQAAFAAEGQGIAYVPLRNYYSPPSGRAESWNPRAFSPSTAAIWLMALSPAVWVALQVVGPLLAPSAAAPALSLAVSAAVFVVLFLCMLADRSVLRGRSMATASIGWFFLGVVPYFTARWLVLRREGTRYVSPIITFVTLLLASAALWVALLNPSALIQ